ncbi:uncharacterized protein [Acropora muricata]|uniref:uncharacterized protein isoform X3 n=1 Tax=Acropora muricata TaxID=159855 RepID=UPI0034E4EA29
MVAQGCRNEPAARFISVTLRVDKSLKMAAKLGDCRKLGILRPSGQSYTHDLRRDNPMLNQLSHRCAVDQTFQRTSSWTNFQKNMKQRGDDYRKLSTMFTHRSHKHACNC